MSPKAILFDIDGTLVDSNGAHVDAWHEAFAGEGFSFDRAAIHDQIGKGADNFIPSLLPNAADDVKQRLEQAHARIFEARYLEEVRAFPGARDLLIRVKEAGKKVFLATSASGSELDHYVRLLDIGEVIDGAASKDDVEHSKPCPDIFAAAARKANVEPSAAMVVGDTPYDIIAARRSGIDTVALRSGRFPEHELEAERPVAIYDDVEALLHDFERSPIGN